MNFTIQNRDLVSFALITYNLIQGSRKHHCKSEGNTYCEVKLVNSQKGELVKCPFGSWLRIQHISCFVMMLSVAFQLLKLVRR